MGERGRYQTRQKEEIADFFRARPEQCVSAEEVHAALESNVGMTTVYRAVARLCEEGFLRRYAPQSTGEASLYQLNPCRESHLHIRCLDCGALAHLSCDVAHGFSDHLMHHHGFMLDEGQTVLYGRCQACAARRKTCAEEGREPVDDTAAKAT